MVRDGTNVHSFIYPRPVRKLDMCNLDLVNYPELKPNYAGDEHDRVCEDLGSYEVKSERGDELREDVAGDALPLRL